jgi:hypothetical protein
MTLKRYLLIMLAATLVCWTLWGVVLFIIDPEVTNWIGFLLFYSTLFLALAGSSAIIGFLVRFAALRQIMVFRLVKEAFRQSFLFSILIVVCLLLLSNGLFTWLNVSFLIIGLTVLEFFLLSYEK